MLSTRNSRRAWLKPQLYKKYFAPTLATARPFTAVELKREVKQLDTRGSLRDKENLLKQYALMDRIGRWYWWIRTLIQRDIGNNFNGTHACFLFRNAAGQWAFYQQDPLSRDDYETLLIELRRRVDRLYKQDEP